MIWGFPLKVDPNSVSMTSYGPWPSFNDKSWTPYPSFSDNRHEDFQEKGEKKGEMDFFSKFLPCLL